MKTAWRWRRLSIFGRTFLLMLAALAVTGTAAVALVHRLPAGDEDMPLVAAAWQLRVPTDGPFSGPPGVPEGLPDRFGGSMGPLPGGRFDMPPPGERFNAMGPGAAGPGVAPVSTLLVTDSPTAPPVPAGTGLALSDPLRTELAQLLGIRPSQVLVYTKASPNLHRPVMLTGSFLVARQLPDSTWRVAKRLGQRFPTTLQAESLGLLALAVAALFAFSWLFARELSAPIRRFSDAARRLGRDPNAPLLAREGPAEMLAAVDSFNAMQARIKRLIQERTQMVGAIAHDLRTPLTRLAFRVDDLPPPLGDKVNADIQEMKEMISAALDFIKDRSLGGQHERLDFRLLLERVVNDQSDLGHDVTLEAGAPVTIEGTPLALRRMVVNLVDNALKYGQRARLRLRADAARCVLEIDDDGPGIPEPLQEHVFEPFFRIEASRNRDTGGIGLGLATVRAIVLDHGGEIALGNRKNGGLRITMSLRTAPT